MDYYEIDLTMLGYREINMLSELLSLAMNDMKKSENVREWFNDTQIKVGFNANSGNVFLFNEDEQVVMETHGRLELFLSCSDCGHEGHESDFKDYCQKDCEGCQETIKMYGL